MSTLTAINAVLYDMFEDHKVLIIAPLRVARDTWSDEVEKWQHTRHLTVSKILGSEKERVAALHQDADLYTVNRENVEWLVNYYKRKWPFTFVVIDELSSFKSPSAKRFKALRKVRPMIKKIVGLTGTPAPNGVKDLWSQIYLLDQGERLGKTYTAFRDKYLQPGRMGRNAHGTLIAYEWDVKAGAEADIYKAIGDICISMKSEDWLDLPERIDVTHEVRLEGKALADYKRLEREFILEHEEGDVEASSSAVLRGKLLQLANGAVYNEDKRAVKIHDLKLDALEDIIEGANGKPVMVAYWFKHDLQRILERFPQAVKFETTEQLKKWNAGKIPVLLIHPMSAGHGLNLQEGGSTLVWFSLTDSLEAYMQTNKRLHRQGQTERVIVHHIVAKGTVDEDVISGLTAKDASQEQLMQAVKARIKRIMEV